MLPEEERAVLASSWKPGTYSLLSSFTTRFASVTYTLASTGTLALAFTDKFPFSGDWKCGDCAEHNFATRMTCRKCNFPKNFTKEELDSKDFKPGDWKCSNCSTNSCESMTDIKTHWKEKKIVDYKCLTDINTGDHNFASRDFCRKCNRPKFGTDRCVSCGRPESTHMHPVCDNRSRLIDSTKYLAHTHEPPSDVCW